MEVLESQPMRWRALWKDFVPNTPDAQRRLREAFDSVGEGIDTSGVVLELRRKDNGKPLWIQWWSRPDPSGTFTRTMFVDITERVLMEQEKARLEAQNVYLQEEIRSEHNFDEIVGSSPAAQECAASRSSRLRRPDSTVLIYRRDRHGQGTHCARHSRPQSRARIEPLVKVNCARDPGRPGRKRAVRPCEGRLHRRDDESDGRFELADSGTIFLDEIGELPLDLQVQAPARLAGAGI